MGYQLGIDLGTTYTAAAVCRSSDRRWVDPEVVTLGTRNAMVPSVLYLPPDGTVVIGEAAERRALTDPDRVVREFKRRIGDPTPVVVGGRPWAPEELSARLVRWVVDQVAEREGGPATAIAVTHPASWGTHKKELLARALGGQGLTVTFLAEPQAAALDYAAAERVPPGSTIAVYDLGGGTFDAAVVRKGDTGFGLLGRPEGLERLGGVDFDEVVFEHVREGLPAAFTDLDDTDPGVLAAVARVRRECTEAKEALSSDTEVSIPVMLPGSRGSVRLHRSEFEALIRPQVEETVAALRTAVTSAGCTPEQLTAVLLVGGSSRIPLVGQLVSEQLGRPVAVDADPKNAIAKGAALSVSPKPTVSWPGVAIPPVAAAAGAVVGTLASPAAPPARPGFGQPGPGQPGAAAFHGPPPGAGPSGPPPMGRPPGRPHAPGENTQGAAARAGGPPRGPRPPQGPPPREPATSVLSGSAAAAAPRPVARPTVRPEPDPDWDYDHEPPQRRRPAGLFVGIGGAVAAAAVIVALLTWPDPGSPPTPTGTGTQVETSQTPDVPVEPTPDGDAGSGAEPAPGGSGGDSDSGGSGGSGGDGGSGGGSGGSGGKPAGGGRGGGVPPAPPPVAPTTVPAPPTTQPAPTTDAPEPAPGTTRATAPGSPPATAPAA
jgi:actin-like ATPase involved in cell morphogenesis